MENLNVMFDSSNKVHWCTDYNKHKNQYFDMYCFGRMPQKAYLLGLLQGVIHIFIKKKTHIKE